MVNFLLQPSLRKIRKKYRNKKKRRRQKKIQKRKRFLKIGKKNQKKILHFQSVRITTVSGYH